MAPTSSSDNSTKKRGIVQDPEEELNRSKATFKFLETGQWVKAPGRAKDTVTDGAFLRRGGTVWLHREQK